MNRTERYRRPTSRGPRRSVAHPSGIAGGFAKTPTEYDWAIDILPPKHCPCCKGRVVVDATLPPSEHLQEDVIDGRYRVVLYYHPSAYCTDCAEWCQQAGELLGSRIGPQLQSKALYLRQPIGISYRKISKAIQELLGVTFTPAALIGFEKFLNKLAKPIIDNIAKKLESSDGAVHAEETYSILDRKYANFWVHATTNYIHFSFGTTRSGQVSRNVWANDLTGTLVTELLLGLHRVSGGGRTEMPC